MNTPPLMLRIKWGAFASISWILLAVILFFRSMMCRMFEVSPFAFLPPGGIFHGFQPLFFATLMHDVLNPIFALGFALLLAYISYAAVKQPEKQVHYELLCCSVLLVFLAYVGSLFLPIGDMAEIINPPR